MKRFFLFIFLTFISTSGCAPHYHDGLPTVGDTWNYTEGLTIKFDACDYWTDDLETTLFLELTFSMDTTSEYKLRWGDVYYYVVPDEKIFSIIDKNEELNGYNIFDVIVREETQYTFYFEVSVDDYFKSENGEIRRGNLTTQCFINPASFEITINLS